MGKRVYCRHREILKPYIENKDNEKAIVRTLVHLLETLIENIVVKNRYLPEDEIREEISSFAWLQVVNKYVPVCLYFYALDLTSVK